jgi:adenylosuccinate lyase
MSDTRPETLFALTALSPLDGRYASKTEALRDWLSEAAFMRHRVTVEIHWLIALSHAGFAEVPRCNWPNASLRTTPHASRKSSASRTTT